jgi:hypothetical protein
MADDDLDTTRSRHAIIIISRMTNALRAPPPRAVVTITGPSYYCTMKDYTAGMPHQVVASDQNANKGKGAQEEGVRQVASTPSLKPISSHDSAGSQNWG